MGPGTSSSRIMAMAVRLFSPAHRKYAAHATGILLVTLVFLTLFFWVRSSGQTARREGYDRVAPFLNLPSVDLSKPLHKTLLRESLDVFHPEASAQNDSLVELARRYAALNVAKLQETLRSGTGLRWDHIPGLIRMYGVFIIAYLLIMGLTYYGVQTMAIYRYIREKQGHRAPLTELLRHAGSTSWQRPGWFKTAAWMLLKTLSAGVGLLALFSPAYVLAYSFRSRFDTDTLIFMIVLGAMSNGLLITYAQKFYTLLVAEGRKGYVETAIVKNLDADYAVPMRTLWRLRKNFPGHVFQHIYINARYQYLLTLKEQASFLITGLIIIEMALNIHGHLCYELLQNILYRQYDAVLVILLGIFLVVKATEVGVDLWKDRETERYENR